MSNAVANPADANIMTAVLTSDSEDTQLRLDLWLKPSVVMAKTCGNSSQDTCPITKAVIEVDYVMNGKDNWVPETVPVDTFQQTNDPNPANAGKNAQIWSARFGLDRDLFNKGGRPSYVALQLVTPQGTYSFQCKGHNKPITP